MEKPRMVCLKGVEETRMKPRRKTSERDRMEFYMPHETEELTLNYDYS
jgi:hypothetical protein